MNHKDLILIGVILVGLFVLQQASAYQQPLNAIVPTGNYLWLIGGFLLVGGTLVLGVNLTADKEELK